MPCSKVCSNQRFSFFSSWPQLCLIRLLFFFEPKGKSPIYFNEYLAWPFPSSALPCCIFKHIVPQGHGCIQIKINKKAITVLLLIEETGSLFLVSMNFDILIKLTNIKCFGSEIETFTLNLSSFSKYWANSHIDFEIQKYLQCSKMKLSKFHWVKWE